MCYALVSIPIELVALGIEALSDMSVRKLAVQSHHTAPFDRLQGRRAAKAGVGAISSKRT